MAISKEVLEKSIIKNQQDFVGKYVMVLGKIIKLTKKVSLSTNSCYLEVGNYSTFKCKENEICVCDRDKNGYGVIIKVDEIKDEPIDLIESKYLTFDRVKYDGKKTFNIDVSNKDGVGLGIIKWHPGWRRYAFFIASGMFFDSECLKDITKYIDQLMSDRKKVKK